MQDKTQEILLYEIRELRKDVKELQKITTGLKVKFGTIAVIFGVIGSFIQKYFMGIMR